MVSTSKTQPSQQKGDQPRKKCDYCGRWGHNFAECPKRIAAQPREGYKPIITVQVDSGADINHGNLHPSMSTSNWRKMSLIYSVICHGDEQDVNHDVLAVGYGVEGVATCASYPVG
ncbi:hypothetical protein ACH5RR_003981 [Cinchona calisaya]|uniref:CCHC-type domain-containing protein n=1 Tax=Cinchona calisaya TaxID=153742 RepID=A0ABD3AWM0_9GENT